MANNRQGSIKQLVKKAKKTRVNRAYYQNCFSTNNVRNMGIVLDVAKTYLDLVEVAQDKNEFIHLFGFTKPEGDVEDVTYFELRLYFASLYLHDSKLDHSKRESNWRLASVDFNLTLAKSKLRLSYKHEQLIDYEARRANADRHEHRNVHKVGSLSLETVLPFSLSRILFNGQMLVESLDNDGNRQASYKPVKLTISTHPTCDKFDYKYRFGARYCARAIEKTLAANKPDNDKVETAARLLDLVLEDRFDQPLMFQGRAELFCSEKVCSESFIMWGAKVKKFVDARLEDDEERDRLFAWSECGHQVHLSRPATSPALVYGFVHASHDYASHLYAETELFERSGEDECKDVQANGSLTPPAAGRQNNADGQQGLRPVPLENLNSFSELSSKHTIKVRGFKKKDYRIEFVGAGSGMGQERPMRVLINGFAGWALVRRLDFCKLIGRAQEQLMTLKLNDAPFTFKLATERLLGGKGNSLVDLARWLEQNRPALANNATDGCNGRQSAADLVSVPRGLVLTSEAYANWLHSDGKILEALYKLNAVRLQVAASSIHLNPFSETSKYLSVAEAQKRMRTACEEASKVLLSCPLPSVLRGRVEADLETLFGGANRANGEPETYERLFAVRSSAVGEDSLETSAAGQMKTILDARGLDSICKAIVECWTSQFELEALTYKSQNGLEFNLPMAVVVQELIECRAAGVAATCDPITGDRTRLSITANWGLGEGVVAGRQTDSVSVLLNLSEGLKWNAQLEEYDLGACKQQFRFEKVAGNSGGDFCLDDSQIEALTCLLLEIRRSSGELRQREVEWGITKAHEDGDKHGQFHIHLLQSRPLTNLQRLSTREIDHELDFGMPCTLDLVSRANLGEVMPGAMSPLSMTWFWPLATIVDSGGKPHSRDHSRNMYVSDQFGFHARIAMLNVTYGDSLKRFGMMADELDEKAGMASQQDTVAREIIYSMVGSTFTEPKDEAERLQRVKFMREKMNPLCKGQVRNFFDILRIDLGETAVRQYLTRSSLLKLDLTEKMDSIDDLSEEYMHLVSSSPSSMDEKQKQLIKFQEYLRLNIHLLFCRLCTRTEVVSSSWMCHILATLSSMAMNALSLKLMCNQPAYVEASGGSLIAAAVLNDFSTLMREHQASERLGELTESGDISKLLDLLLERIDVPFEGGQSSDSGGQKLLSDHMRSLKQNELYAFLTSEENVKRFECCKLFTDFMQRNTHRAWKEFCMSTKTWGDDPSYIMRTLALRLRGHTPESGRQAREKRLERDRKQQAERERIEGRLRGTGGSTAVAVQRMLLLKFALPRARKATVRREASKSDLIKTVHKYRLAFRHLGGLLCLAGLMPDADLVFYLTIGELDEIIRKCCALKEGERSPPETVMPRLLYKARRRQQRTRPFDLVNFSRPTIPIMEMFSSIEEQTIGDYGEQTTLAPQPTEQPASNQPSDGDEPGRPEVRGIISCAGRVTGRACVIDSLDDADQIEPNDILITYSIDISWSVYFFMLSGIVTEVGGIVSHGAVVAREYGLPTLCTAIGARSTFKTGQMIVLDANAGVCYAADAGVSEASPADGQQQAD